MNMEGGGVRLRDGLQNAKDFAFVDVRSMHVDTAPPPFDRTSLTNGPLDKFDIDNYVEGI